jgi:hypothetical protein
MSLLGRWPSDRFQGRTADRAGAALTTTLAAAFPPIVTEVWPDTKFVPVMVTELPPETPELAVMPVTVGAWAKACPAVAMSAATSSPAMRMRRSLAIIPPSPSLCPEIPRSRPRSQLRFGRWRRGK